ncbi:MAG: FkbM family methyltransferase [Limnoraphis robusta]|jgi:FkbM family methyltransferase
MNKIADNTVNFWEHILQEEFQDFIEAIDCYFDRNSVKTILELGSRDGFIALEFTKYFPNATVYAFECNPEAVELCQKNIDGHNRVVLVNKAVSDHNGFVDFYAIDPTLTQTHLPDGSIGVSSLYQSKNLYPYETYVQNKIQVEAIRLEDWARENQIEGVDLIWMDLQGAELKALQGVGNLLNDVRAIYTEVAYQQLYVDQPLFKDIDEYITAKGFRFLKTISSHEWEGNVLYLEESLIDRAKLSPSLLGQPSPNFSCKIQWNSVEKIVYFPPICTVENETVMPAWSVIIPVFKSVENLNKTVNRLLEETADFNSLQIELVSHKSEGSIRKEIEAIVKAVGDDRIHYYHHDPFLLDEATLFNLCIQRAQGEWIHILQPGDWVNPGFYQNFQMAIAQEPNLGAIFSRQAYIDETGDCRWISWVERETPGLLSDWIKQIGVRCRIPLSSIAVKRSVYEKLGGFCSQAGVASEWEMWKRIAAHYPVWYEPEPLVSCYRNNENLSTNFLLKSIPQTQDVIADINQSIQITRSYLPPSIANEISKQARERNAFFALNIAKTLLSAGEYEEAIAFTCEALKLSQSERVKNALTPLFLSYKPEAKSPALTPE